MKFQVEAVYEVPEGLPLAAVAVEMWTDAWREFQARFCNLGGIDPEKWWGPRARGGGPPPAPAARLGHPTPVACRPPDSCPRMPPPSAPLGASPPH